MLFTTDYSNANKITYSPSTYSSDSKMIKRPSSFLKKSDDNLIGVLSNSNHFIKKNSYQPSIERDSVKNTSSIRKASSILINYNGYSKYVHSSPSKFKPNGNIYSGTDKNSTYLHKDDSNKFKIFDEKSKRVTTSRYPLSNGDASQEPSESIPDASRYLRNSNISIKKESFSQRYRAKNSSPLKTNKFFLFNNPSIMSSKSEENFTKIDNETELIPKNPLPIVSQDGICSGEQRLSPSDAVKKYGDRLPKHERSEIFKYQDIYYLGLGVKKRFPHGTSIGSLISESHVRDKEISSLQKLIGFDDSDSAYITIPHDQVAFRYELIGVLGKGSFGHVLRVIDHKTREEIALKIVRSESRFSKQATEEIRILDLLRKSDKDHKNNVIHLYDYFVFRGHVCMTFELLRMNLYELIYKNRFKGFEPKLIQKLTHGILVALCHLKKYNIVHCDLKPENILIRNDDQTEVKIIDFGSSCFSNERTYMYIQSRYYRAPEVILGAPYSTPIDMWSLGCIVAELLTGVPIFPGENEYDQLACIVEVLGVPSEKVIMTGKRSRIFFTSRNEPRYMVDLKDQYESLYETRGGDTSVTSKISRSYTAAGRRHQRLPKRAHPGSIDLPAMLKQKFSQGYSRGNSMTFDHLTIDFLRKCFNYDPEERLDPHQGLRHSWLADIVDREIDNTCSHIITTSTHPSKDHSQDNNNTSDVFSKENSDHGYHSNGSRNNNNNCHHREKTSEDCNSSTTSDEKKYSFSSKSGSSDSLEMKKHIYESDEDCQETKVRYVNIKKRTDSFFGGHPRVASSPGSSDVDENPSKTYHIIFSSQRKATQQNPIERHSVKKDQRDVSIIKAPSES